MFEKGSGLDKGVKNGFGRWLVFAIKVLRRDVVRRGLLLGSGAMNAIIAGMSQAPFTVYIYSGCSTCRNALKWLRDNQVDFVGKPIRETPPSVGELQRMLDFQNGNLRRLFNTSGLEYRALKLSEKLPTMKENDALALLAGNGRLVKRPFILGDSFGLVGFDSSVWAEAFGK